MRIISKWRDYYDHVQKDMGGGDPKVLYFRDIVIPDRIWEDSTHTAQDERVPSAMTFHLPDEISTWRNAVKHTHRFQALIVLGKLYFLEWIGVPDVRSITGAYTAVKDWHVTERPIYNDHMGSIRAWVVMEERDPYRRTRRPDTRKIENLDVIPQGQFSRNLVSLSRHVKAPVFRVDDTMHVQGRCPNLGELGFVQYYSAQQLYQELAMFLTNVLVPYRDPPSRMTDIEKVSAHGFDRKQSFRHRK
jgi:hypothetical protein